MIEFILKRRNVCIIGTLMQFVMFYLTKPYMPDTIRYFHMATTIKQGNPKPLLFASLLAYSPFPFVVTGYLIEIISYQLLMLLTYRLTKKPLAVLLVCMLMSYHSTIIATETLFAVLILWAVLLYEQNKILVCLPIVMSISLRMQSFVYSDFRQQVCWIHQSWGNQLVHTLSFFSVQTFLVLILWAVLKNKIGRIPLTVAVILLCIPCPPASFIRYMLPWMPLCVIAVV